MNTAVNAIQNLLTAYQQKTALETCKEVTATMLDFQEEKEIDDNATEEVNALLELIQSGALGKKGKINFYGIILHWSLGE